MRETLNQTPTVTQLGLLNSSVQNIVANVINTSGDDIPNSPVKLDKAAFTSPKKKKVRISELRYN